MTRGTTATPSPESRLLGLGIDLPPPSGPFASYRSTVRAGKLLFLAGQGPVRGKEMVFQGKLGADVSDEDGYQAARLTGLNVLAVARDALGSLDEVARVANCTVWVACTAEFTNHPKVADGVTDLFREVFQEEGLPARAAVGAPSLPMNIPVEAQVTFELRD